MFNAQNSPAALPKFLGSLWAIGIILILISYFLIDKPLCSFIFTHHLSSHLYFFSFIKNLIEWPGVFELIAPLLLFIFLLIFLLPNSKNNLKKYQSMLILVTLSVSLTFLIKNDLKWIFSRDWPTTWTHDNLSWIKNQAYGFQWFQGPWFQGTDSTGSFPSGHSSIAFASLISVGLVYKKLLKVCVLFASLEALSMVLFNYHFLSDVIAGACLGITIAMLCNWILNKKYLINH